MFYLSAERTVAFPTLPVAPFCFQTTNLHHAIYTTYVISVIVAVFVPAPICFQIQVTILVMMSHMF